MTTQPPRLQAQFISTIRTLHYSRRTQEAYWHWIRAFIIWSGKRHPLEMGKVEVGQFLSHLATERNVSASTQRQALAAVLFLYQKVLGQAVPWMDAIGRPQRQPRLPVVLSQTFRTLIHSRLAVGMAAYEALSDGMKRRLDVASSGAPQPCRYPVGQAPVGLWD